MKRLTFFLIITLLSLTFLPHPSHATTEQQAFAVVKIRVFDKRFINLDNFEDAQEISRGSGVIISKTKDEIITNYHVIKSYLEDPDNRTLLACLTFSYTESPDCVYMGTVQRYNEALDLAIVKIEQGYSYDNRKFMELSHFDLSDIPYVTINKFLFPEDIQLGNAITTLGYPAAGGESITLTTGVASGFDTITVKGKNYIRYITTDAKVNPGNSGGGAFDANNDFIGIPTRVAGGDGNIGYIIPTKTVALFVYDDTSYQGLNWRDLEKRIQELQEEYEAWLRNQCGENSLLDEESGQCVCEEGYVWADEEDDENLNCVEATEEEKSEEGNPEGESEGTENQCGPHEILSEDEGCQCEEGYELQDDECVLQEAPEDISKSDEPVFSDLPRNHRNRIAIAYLKEHDVIGGYPDGTFQPAKPVNRAELLKILIEAQAKDFISSAHDTECFSDVSRGEWFTPYVCYAKGKDWVKGYQDNTFKPAQTVSKVEAIKIVLEAFGVFIPEQSDRTYFEDTTTADWFASYLQVAKEQDFLEELSGKFQPHQGMTRASVSEVIYRILQYVSGPTM